VPEPSDRSGGGTATDRNECTADVVWCGAMGTKDGHGEVYPAICKEGARTFSGDPTTKLDYFAAVDAEPSERQAK